MKRSRASEHLKKPEKKMQSQTRRLQELSFQDTERLIHELEENRAELERHNEELCRLQGELEDSRNKYSDLYDFAPVGYFTFDKRGLITDVNLTGAGLLGVKKQFLVNKPFTRFIEAGDQDIFQDHLRDVLRGHYPQTCEIRLRRKDGKAFYAQLQSLPVKDAAGEVTHSRTTMSDVTKLMDTEDSLLMALHETQKMGEEISALLESTRSVLKYHDFAKTAESIFHACKNLIKARCGYVTLLNNGGTEDEVLFLDTGGYRCTVNPPPKMPVHRLLSMSENPGKTTYLNNFAVTQWKAYPPEGHISISNILFAPMIIDEKIIGVLGLANKRGGFTDDDARMASAFSEIAAIAIMNKRAEETVRRSEEYFRLVTENSLDIITILEKDGIIRYESPSVERVLGFQRDKLVGRNVFEFVHPDDKERAMNVFSRAIENPGVSLSLEVRFLHKDGSWRVLEVIGKNLLDNPAVAGIVVNSRDITGRKLVEEDLVQLADELKRSNTDLQQFAYAASHDLQEPLRVIAGFVKLLGKRYKDRLDSKAEEFIAHTVDGVKRMEILIKDLLAYSQIGTKGRAFRPTDCTAAVDNAVANLQAVIEENDAEVIYDRLPTIMADSTQLSRLFQNLISNAIKFRRGKKPKVHIDVESKEDEWIFSVRDNGIGIEPKDVERIFVIFQRLHTREQYSGTGIGLAVCKRIVERHGGRLWVESQPGKGSTFYFSIPNTEETDWS